MNSIRLSLLVAACSLAFASPSLARSKASAEVDRPQTAAEVAPKRSTQKKNAVHANKVERTKHTARKTCPANCACPRCAQKKKGMTCVSCPDCVKGKKCTNCASADCATKREGYHEAHKLDRKDHKNARVIVRNLQKFLADHERAIRKHERTLKSKKRQVKSANKDPKVRKRHAKLEQKHQVLIKMLEAMDLLVK